MEYKPPDLIRSFGRGELPTSVNEWLERVVSTLDGSGQEDSGAQDKQRLLYLLDRRTNGRQMTVHPVLVHLSEDGRYGATKSFSFTGGSHRPAYLSAEDRELLPAILGNSSEYWSSGCFFSPTTIDAAAGARLLGRLLATGRCHWRDPGTPALERGEQRTGRVEWKFDQEGRQWPRLLVDGDAKVRALNIDPPWYVDPSKAIAGPIELDLTSETVATLLDAPGLEPESVEHVRAALTQSEARLPLPASVSGDLEPRTLQPVPQLLLRAWEPEPAHGGWSSFDPPEKAAVELSFDYEGMRVRSDDPRKVLQRVADGRLVRVRRDFECEGKAIGVLEKLRFVPLGDAGFRGAAGSHEPATVFVPHHDARDVEIFLIDFGQFGVPLLRENGWVVEIAADYPFHVIAGAPQWFAEISEGTNQWFDLDLGVEIDGEKHSLLPILVELLRDPRFRPGAKKLAAMPDAGQFPLRLGDGRLIVLPMERVRAILNTLIGLFAEDSLGDRGTLSLTTWNSSGLVELDETLGAGALRWSGGEHLRELGRKLHDFRGMPTIEVPRAFLGRLRPYQREGLNWLQFLREHDLSGVLADDMGLGKTVQVLAHLLVEKQAGRMKRPCLVVAPTSVNSNWRREAERFAPDLKVLVLYGPSRRERFAQLAEHDLALTTYSLLSRDREALLRQPYHMLILDEAQFVKNAKTRTAAVAGRIEAQHRQCLTGTPMENHLGELWSLFQILMPGFLGDAKQFRRLFRTPIETYDDASRREQLAKRVRPFLLRRTKDRVARELPPKTEVTRTIELRRAQRDLYESLRVAMHDKVRKEIACNGLERSTIVILDALLKLRQVCCDPRLLKIAQAHRVKRSAKLVALMEMLDQMLTEGRRILLFSQFTSMIALIEEELRARGIDWVRIIGDTRDRDTPVRRFQEGKVPLFLISLKAGGTGLNLTAADAVIHYDPWWNPAVEDQATDRAHRIGQGKPVFSYRLIVAGSVEEKMLALQARKRELAEGIYGARGGKGAAPLSAEDLDVLFRPLG